MTQPVQSTPRTSLSIARKRELGRVIYLARIKAAWGQHWTARDIWPADEKAWRAYEHTPAAAVDLALIEAEAALAWMAEQ